MPSEPSCSCCGVPSRIYEEKGHDPECIWYEDEMYRLAEKWWGGDGGNDDWKTRYDMIVGFLLEQTTCLKRCLDEERVPPKKDADIEAPNCDCGNVLKVESFCMTSFPCQHDAKCEVCGKTYTVYGIGANCDRFTRDLETAFKAS